MLKSGKNGINSESYSTSNHWQHRSLDMQYKQGMSLVYLLNRIIIQITNVSDILNPLLQAKIEVPRDVRNVKSENMTSSGEIGLNIVTNTSPKLDRTRCPEE